MSETVEAPRIDWPSIAPEAMKALMALEKAVAAKVDRKLFHLIKLRASQMNGCAYCIAMHVKEALNDGEQILRLTLLDVWRESHLYDERERAALEWTEAVTRIADGHAPREIYDRLSALFSPEEVANITLAATAINAWNRVAIAGRSRHAD